MAVFVSAYRTFGIPFSLGTVVAGVAAVITTRYTLGFLVIWFGEALRTYYTRHLQLQAFNNTLETRIEYFDQEGSDDIINAIITQTFYAGRVIKRIVQFLQTLMISLVYLFVAFVIAPLLTLFAVIVLGAVTVIVRFVLEPGYTVGDRVAGANEKRQRATQAGTQRGGAPDSDRGLQKRPAVEVPALVGKLVVPPLSLRVLSVCAPLCWWLVGVVPCHGPVRLPYWNNRFRQFCEICNGYSPYRMEYVPGTEGYIPVSSEHVPSASGISHRRKAGATADLAAVR